MGQTVNLLAHAYGGSNPSLPTTLVRRPRSSRKFAGKFAEVAQLVEHQPSKLRVAGSNLVFRSTACQSSSGVERFLGKEEVESSNLSSGSKILTI